MEKLKTAKYSVGDKVTIISNGNNGVIKDIVSYLGEGDNIYLIDVSGREKVCVESNLELIEKKNIVADISVFDVEVTSEIEDKIKEIIELLDLRECTSEKDQLINASKLQTFLTINEDYEEHRKMIGDSVFKNQLYHGVVNGDSDSFINTYLFSEILRKVGMDVLNVALKDEDGNFYMANLVLIGKDYYYFDVTLEIEVFMDNGSKKDEFVLCCGALGKTSYEQFFTPLCILEFDNKLSPCDLPENISKDDIDIDLINKLLLMGNE